MAHVESTSNDVWVYKPDENKDPKTNLNQIITSIKQVLGDQEGNYKIILEIGTDEGHKMEVDELVKEIKEFNESKEKDSDKKLVPVSVDVNGDVLYKKVNNEKNSDN